MYILYIIYINTYTYTCNNFAEYNSARCTNEKKFRII